ncbi:MAG: phytanoyl-CoA dioxygenase family protein [Candidatus Latescibacteria bacterium]|nr:phytanoyl-CoA dioxygenase family protein [Candidatus Latescibacterota bacterium]
MQTEFAENGFYVLRGVLTEDEVDRLAGPIRAAFAAGTYDGFNAEAAYPQPGVYSMGPRVLADHPEIAEVSLAHPGIVGAVEELFGEPATLAQYWSIMRPPGAGVGDEPFVSGSGAHFDYKPWRCVGSFVKWMFAVIPFVDYTEEVGPLCVDPGSHRKTRVLPSDGRVHQVDAAQVPVPAEINFVDPQLEKGDAVLMHGFCWHEARPNYGASDRCGLYMKFHAKSSPPACGPTIYPSTAHDALPPSARHLLPYHRGDGQYAAVRDVPVGGIDEGRLLIEDSEGLVLVLGDGAGGWALPRYAAAEDETAGILDVCNVMGSVLNQARAQLGLPLPWLSWLQDVAGAAPDGGAGEWRCRVYGHRLHSAAPEIRGEHRWIAAADLATAAGQLGDGEAVRQWLRMWQEQVDEEGRSVTRSFGLPTTDVEYFTYNKGSNPQGTYRIGVFDSQGRPTPPPPKLAAKT